jgi:hypothetical protein
MTGPHAPTLEQRLRLHNWGLFNAYAGDLREVAAAACSHGGHETEADVMACVCSEILVDFLKNWRNREVVLAAVVASQEAA